MITIVLMFVALMYKVTTFLHQSAKDPLPRPDVILGCLFISPAYKKIIKIQVKLINSELWFINTQCIKNDNIWIKKNLF